MKAIQLALPFEGRWQPIADAVARDPLPPEEHVNAHAHWLVWLGAFGLWWGAMLRGNFDGRVCPTSFHARSITLVRGRTGWGVCMDAANNEGETLTTSYWDSSRVKALHGFRYKARRGELQWKMRGR